MIGKIKSINLISELCYAVGQISNVVVNGQILKKYTSGHTEGQDVSLPLTRYHVSSVPRLFSSLILPV